MRRTSFTLRPMLGVTAALRRSVPGGRWTVVGCALSFVAIVALSPFLTDQWTSHAAVSGWAALITLMGLTTGAVAWADGRAGVFATASGIEVRDLRRSIRVAFPGQVRTVIVTGPVLTLLDHNRQALARLDGRAWSDQEKRVFAFDIAAQLETAAA